MFLNSERTFHELFLKISQELRPLNSPTLVQDILQISKDRRLCVVGKSFAYETRISNGEITSLVLILAIVTLLVIRKCLVTHAVVCICASSETRYTASAPGVHHPRAAEKMWANIFLMPAGLADAYKCRNFIS